MKCKYCKAKISANDKKCPKCKKPVAQQENTAGKRSVLIFSSVALLVTLGVVLLVVMLGGWDLGSWFRGKENDVYYKKDYTVKDRKVKKKRDVVVATAGDAKLTNAMLQIYYWRQVHDFQDQYGSTASYFGLDFSKDLAEQTYLDGKTTWQQYFLTSALEAWQSNQAFAALAKQNGYELPEEYQEFLANVDQHLEDVAAESGYSSADAMVKVEVGATCTAADYAEYLRVYYWGYLYFRELYDAMEPTEEEIDQYFQDNKDSYEESGITKDGSVVVDIRHIMLYPENGKMSASGTVYYSQEDWDECLAQAEKLLSTWKNGEMTEDSFAELAKEHSEDTTTKSKGGLYTDVEKGDLMKAIDTWCFDAARKTGDYTLVKTDYGYHLIYFVEAEEVWHAEVRTTLRTQMGQEMVDETLKDFVLDVDYKQIVLGSVNLSK